VLKSRGEGCSAGFWEIEGMGCWENQLDKACNKLESVMLNNQNKGQKERVMEIKVTQTNNNDLKSRPTDESQIGFGDIFTDHMFLMDYESGTGSHRTIPQYLN